MKKPSVKLTGTNGNTLALLGLCIKELKKIDKYDEAQDLTIKVFHAKSYQEALKIMSEYCDIS